jgi:hypothetical protein
VKAGTDMSKIYRNIPVSPEVYQAVSQIAKSNYRTMGGQVAFWTVKCPHLAGGRTIVGITVVSLGGTQIQDDDGSHPLTKLVQIVHCQECGQLLVLPADPFDADQSVVAEAGTANG